MRTFVNIILLCFAMLPAYGSATDKCVTKGLIKRENRRNILTIRPSFDGRKDDLYTYINNIYSCLDHLEISIYNTIKLSNEVLNKDRKYRTEPASMASSGLLNDELCMTFHKFKEDHENLWQQSWSESITKIDKCEMIFDLYEIRCIIRRVFVLCNMMVKALMAHSDSEESAPTLRKLLMEQLSELSSNIYELTHDQSFIDKDCIVMVDLQLYNNWEKLCYRWSLMWEKEGENNISRQLSQMYTYCQTMIESNITVSSQTKESMCGMIETKTFGGLWSDDFFGVYAWVQFQ
ncbi:hypothetical protein THOM_1511 [Trachipleistophora hominis]|uniref:Uncharacterized protein n=1 Tax=Trachipleistophora hominis TaxID=72359 RepID=L7JVM3_TRAHO|nr:hypothetical protein THOM_1511 [Trachipleistophora hominis]